MWRGPGKGVMHRDRRRATFRRVRFSSKQQEVHNATSTMVVSADPIQNPNPESAVKVKL
jgi:hypothetical protein